MILLRHQESRCRCSGEISCRRHWHWPSIVGPEHMRFSRLSMLFRDLASLCLRAIIALTFRYVTIRTSCALLPHYPIVAGRWPRSEGLAHSQFDSHQRTLGLR